MVRGCQLPTQRELRREIDHLERAVRHAEQAGLQTLTAAMALGAPVELVIRTQEGEQVRQVRFTRDPRGEGRFKLAEVPLVVDGLQGTVRETTVRLHKGAMELPVSNPLINQSTICLGDELNINSLNIEVNDGTNT